MSRNFIAFACVGLVSLPTAAAESSITMTYPSTGVSSTGSRIDTVTSNIATTVPGWKEVPESQFQYFPEHYNANVFTAVIPDMTRIPSGSSTTFRCNNNAMEPCTVAAFYYSCHPCESGAGNKAVGMALTAMGFERTRCAPTFTTGVAGGIQHRMVGYVKTIAHGETETIVLDGDLDFAMFALSNGGGVTCSNFATANECEAPGVNDFCKYMYGECRLATCVSAGPPVGNGCDLATCARTELPF